MSLDGGRELRVMHALEKHGWLLVSKSGGSRGPADLVMVHPAHGLALIQVGAARKFIGPHERARLMAMADLCSALPLCATPLPGVGLRVRLVTADTARAWPEFDPVNGLDPVGKADG